MLFEIQEVVTPRDLRVLNATIVHHIGVLFISRLLVRRVIAHVLLLAGASSKRCGNSRSVRWSTSFG